MPTAQQHSSLAAWPACPQQSMPKAPLAALPPTRMRLWCPRQQTGSMATGNFIETTNAVERDHDKFGPHFGVSGARCLPSVCLGLPLARDIAETRPLGKASLAKKSQPLNCRVQIRIYIYIIVSICKSVQYVYLYLYIYIYAYVCVSLYLFWCTYYIYIHIHMHIHIHIHKHIHIYICII